ncbi:MAG: hypothetical protein Fur0015_05630 [Ignavibacteriales bacterium]
MSHNYISINIMKELKEKVISISLLLILCLPFILTYSWIQFRKASIRHEFKEIIKQEISQEFLVNLTFHKNEIKSKLRFEHPDEFEYESKMYDVVKIKYEGDSVHFYCWLDDEETEMNKNLTTLILNTFSHDAAAQGKEKKLNDFSHSLFFLEKFYINNYLSCNGNYNLSYSNKYSLELNREIFKPPKINI